MALDDTQVFLPEVWASHARFRADKPALICGADRYTWGELNRRCNIVANRLLAAELGKPAKVATLMGNSGDTAIVLLGIMKSGACVVPMSTLLTPAQVATLLEDSGASALITDGANRALADEALQLLDAPLSGPRLLSNDRAEGWVNLQDWLGAGEESEPAVRYSSTMTLILFIHRVLRSLPRVSSKPTGPVSHWSYSNALELRMDQQHRRPGDDISL